MQRRFSSTEPLLLEKIIASLSYLTSSTVGFLWLILAILTKQNLKPFLKYHIFQSIFLAIGFFLLSFLVNALGNILSYIPFLNMAVMHISYLLGSSLIPNVPSIIDLIIYAIVFYLAITSFMGKYTYIPWVSDIINANVKNS